MSNYKLIAFDMDGTLLNSEKQISQKTIEAINKATSLGKIVIFNTGRAVDELKEYFDILPGVRYLNCLSGGLVYDLKEEKEIYRQFLSIDTVLKILDIVQKKDIFIQMLNQHSFVQTNMIERMDEFQVGVYKPMYRRVATRYSDIKQEYRLQPFPMGKINLIHHTPEQREETMCQIESTGLDVQMAFSEVTSLECSAKGISKAIGLQELCKYLDISLQQVIVVGDADNDLQALQIAGLPIAMGNSNERVKAIAKAIVSDNDHDGCGEAIEKYLLSE